MLLCFYPCLYIHLCTHCSAIPYVLSLANLISKLSLKGVKEISSLEITPSAHEVVLNLHTDFILKCSGHNEVLWKTDNKHSKLDTFLEKRGTIFTNTLTLRNLTGLNTGEYSCADNQVLDEKAIYIFVPGTGDCTTLILLIVQLMLQVYACIWFCGINRKFRRKAKTLLWMQTWLSR